MPIDMWQPRRRYYGAAFAEIFGWEGFDLDRGRARRGGGRPPEADPSVEKWPALPRGRGLTGPSPAWPVWLTSFVGREREIAVVVRLVAHNRLVTLVGAPGVGKTRLAVQIAEIARERLGGGVWLVELAGLREPSLVAQAVASALGLQDQPGRPPTAALADALKGRDLLLVLDNCEHLAAACAPLVAELLRGCPRLHILATSREPLLTEGETLWRVPSLAIPAPAVDLSAASDVEAVLVQYEAVRLFVDRARAASSTFALAQNNAAAVAEICRRLDGIPLAIELAAARVRGLSAREIAGHLDESFDLLAAGSRTAISRQQTLRAALDWSHALLSEPERTLLCRLSVFAGGWTLEAAGAVCDLPATLDLLLGLVDRSLVQAEPGEEGETRYRLLETIRQYGRGRLAADEEVAIQRRHLDWFLALAERVPLSHFGPDTASLIDRLTAEQDNVRAALAWSLADSDSGSIEDGLRLATAWYPVWLLRNHLVEGRRWLEQVLERHRQHSVELGQAVDSLGAAAVDAAPRPESGRGLPKEGPAGIGTHPRVAALNAASFLAFHQQDSAQATAHLEEALFLARRARDLVGAAQAIITLGDVTRARGEYDRSAAFGEEGVAMARAAGRPHTLSRALRTLGEVIEMQGDHARARRLLEEALAAGRAADYCWGIAQALRNLAGVAYREGDLTRAAALLEESLIWWGKIHATRGRHWALREFGHVALARGDRDQAAAYFAESLTLNREAGDRRGIAICLEGLAAAHAETGSGAEAGYPVWLLAAAAALREAVGTPVSPMDRRTYEQAVAESRARLGEEAYASAWAEGRALPVDQVIELALASASSGSRADGPAGAPPEPDLQPSPPELPLTPREREVASLVAQGLTNRKIAERLVISERTADGHVARILAKLDLANRAQLAAWAERTGLTGSDRD